MDKTLLKQVKEVVGKVAVPDFVRDIEYELDEDHLGDPCVRIRLVIADGSFPVYSGDSEALLRDFAPYREIENQISDAVIKSGVGLWPYLSIASESERAAIVNLA